MEGEQQQEEDDDEGEVTLSSAKRVADPRNPRKRRGQKPRTIDSHRKRSNRRKQAPTPKREGVVLFQDEEGREYWHVEAVCGRRVLETAEIQYWIKWLDYDGPPSWESHENILLNDNATIPADRFSPRDCPICAGLETFAAHICWQTMTASGRPRQVKRARIAAGEVDDDNEDDEDFVPIRNTPKRTRKSWPTQQRARKRNNQAVISRAKRKKRSGMGSDAPEQQQVPLPRLSRETQVVDDFANPMPVEDDASGMFDSLCDHSIEIKNPDGNVLLELHDTPSCHGLSHNASRSTSYVPETSRSCFETMGWKNDYRFDLSFVIRCTAWQVAMLVGMALFLLWMAQSTLFSHELS